MQMSLIELKSIESALSANSDGLSFVVSRNVQVGSTIQFDSSIVCCAVDVRTFSSADITLPSN
jgi:hypothetical protein